MKKVKPVIALWLVFLLSTFYAQKETRFSPDPHRFDNAISVFKNWDDKNSFPANAVLFVGSSSIRMWKTQKYFPRLKVINRGFGGSHISDVIYFFDDVVKKYKPAKIVFYCGDNDIAAGKTPERVYSDFKRFVKMVEDSVGKIDLIFIPIKPSINRWKFWTEMNKANMMIKEFIDMKENLFYADIVKPMLNPNGIPQKEIFLEDGLHLNNKGYKIWTTVLEKYLR